MDGAADPFTMDMSQNGAYERGIQDGEGVGRQVAEREGFRLGRLHGAAFGGELGGMEGFSLVLSALIECNGFFKEDDNAGDAVGRGSVSGRVEKSAARVQEMVSSCISLASSSPLPEQTDVMDTILMCRAKTKVCCAALGLPVAAADLSGWKVKVGESKEGKIGAGGAALDF